MPAISSAWSAKGSGGRCGGASGWVRAARSVAVRSSKDSVSVEDSIRKRSVCQCVVEGYDRVIRY